MAFKYEVNGHIVEFEREPSEQDIDEAAAQLGSAQSENSSIDFGKAFQEGGKALLNPEPMQVATSGMDRLGGAAGATVGSIYGQARDSLKGKIPNGVKELIGQIIKGGVPPANLFSDEEVGDFGSGVGIDLASGAVAGLTEPIPEAIATRGIKGFDKNITSLLKRISGKEGTDIKQLRQLEAKYGKGFVLDKQKSKPEYLSREVSPKAANLASSRVRSLEPEALTEIGVNPESVEIAKNLKQKFNMQSLPTKSEASKMFGDVVDAAPSDVLIDTTNLENAFREHGPSLRYDLGKERYEYLSRLLNRTRTNELGTLERTGITKDEFNNARGILNDIVDQGNNVAAQATKSALDADAEAVIQGLSEAKGAFQLSQEMPKAQGYLDKPKLEIEMNRQLESGVNPKNTLVRDSLNRLLGPEGESLIDTANAQRLSKDFYTPSNISTRPVGNVHSLLDLIRIPANLLQRGYEKMRSSALSPRKPSPSYKMKPETPFSYNVKPYSGTPRNVSVPETPPMPRDLPSGPDVIEVTRPEVTPYGEPYNPENNLGLRDVYIPLEESPYTRPTSLRNLVKKKKKK